MKICPKANSSKGCISCHHNQPHEEEKSCHVTGLHDCPNKCVDVVEGQKTHKKTNDKENIIKAIDCANLLCSDLQALIKSKNICLSVIALDLMQKVVEVENKLKQIKE